MVYGDFMGYLKAAAKFEKRQVLNMAIAARMAQSENKNWQKWTDDLKTV